MSEVAFIGDIHGEMRSLEQVLAVVLPRASRLVFLGDYVNRGPDACGVIERLLDLTRDASLSVTFLEGNHDRVLLEALESRDLRTLLRTGGAPTVRSYIGSDPEPDVATQLLAQVPKSHIEFLNSLKSEVTLDSVHAAHHPPPPGVTLPEGARYGVYGHVPQTDQRPAISPEAAFIDTGCGTTPNGRLTALFWPKLDWVQSEPSVGLPVR